MSLDTNVVVPRRLRLGLAALAVATCVGASPAAADDLQALCDAALNVKQGQWAEYKAKGKSPNGASRIRIAIVDAKPVAGKKAWWIELQMTGGENRMTAQILAGGYPFRGDQIHEMVIKTGDQPAMKVPQAGLQMMQARVGVTPSMGADEQCRNAKVVGWESVTVPAGTFRALRIEPKDDQKADVWAVKEIPFGMVKVVHADGEMVLVGHGEDAKSSIRETPIVIPGFGG